MRRYLQTKTAESNLRILEGYQTAPRGSILLAIETFISRT